MEKVERRLNLPSRALASMATRGRVPLGETLLVE